jgi:hypothetical protein
MGMDIYEVKLNKLPRPQGLAYQFIGELATEAQSWGEGNAFGFYQRNELEERARSFAKDNVLGETILMDWIKTLPWDEDGHVTLNFNW